MSSPVASIAGPPPDCRSCPRLHAFREDNRRLYPDYFNDPVPAFGDDDAWLLIVGLAPGLKGANKTGRPFTGDYAGDLLYETLSAFGFSEGRYDRRADDGLTLRGCRITNAVRCVPPENKPVGGEIRNCNDFLAAEMASLPNLKVILSLGVVSHGAVLSSLGLKKSSCRFSHAALHSLPNGLRLADSYHCSRYNTNTGRLTREMFAAVFQGIKDLV